MQRGHAAEGVPLPHQRRSSYARDRGPFSPSHAWFRPEAAVRSRVQEWRQSSRPAWSSDPCLAYAVSIVADRQVRLSRTEFRRGSRWPSRPPLAPGVRRDRPPGRARPDRELRAQAVDDRRQRHVRAHPLLRAAHRADRRRRPRSSSLGTPAPATFRHRSRRCRRSPCCGRCLDPRTCSSPSRIVPGVARSTGASAQSRSITPRLTVSSRSSGNSVGQNRTELWGVPGGLDEPFSERESLLNL
jgi:hypothetical protein